MDYSKLELRKQGNVEVFGKETVWAGQAMSSEVAFLQTSVPLRPIEDSQLVKYFNHSSIYPLHINEARYISSMVNICLQKLVKSKAFNSTSLNIPALLFKCDVTHPEYIAWFYSRLELSQQDERVKCTKKTFVVNNLKETLPLYQSLVTKLETENGVRVFQKTNQEINRSNCAYYDVHRSTLGDSTVTVDFCWQGFSKPLTQPPAGCNAVIKFQANPRNPMSAAHSIFQEVVQLYRIFDSMESGVWCEEGTVDNFEEKVEEFKQYLSMEKEVKDTEKKDETKLSTPNSPLYDLLLSEYSRKDIDFTDDLWTFLKDLGSYNASRSALRQVFMAIFGGSLQPVLSSTNKTTMAEFLRDFYRNVGVATDTNSYYERLRNMLDDQSQLLTILLQMGVQKLKSDYMAYFQKMEVATQLQLEGVIGDNTSVRKTLNGIMKLHYALEIMLLAKMHFRLTDDLLRTLSKSVFDYYSHNEPADSTPTFALAVPSYAASATEVHKKCLNLPPAVWKCCVPMKHKITGAVDCLLFVFRERSAGSDLSVQNDDDTDMADPEDATKYELLYGRSSDVRMI